MEFRTCFNGNKDCHHEEAPRGSKTGTQGLKGNMERSVVPRQLCIEILKQLEKYKTWAIAPLYVTLGKTRP